MGHLTEEFPFKALHYRDEVKPSEYKACAKIDNAYSIQAWDQRMYDVLILKKG